MRSDSFSSLIALSRPFPEKRHFSFLEGGSFVQVIAVPQISPFCLLLLNDVPSYCGNGVIEPGELCDGNSVQCTTLDPDYTGGTAACNSTCDGYNESYCEEDGW